MISLCHRGFTLVSAYSFSSQGQHRLVFPVRGAERPVSLFLDHLTWKLAVVLSLP